MTAADHANTDVLRTRLLGALNGYATDTETAWEIIKRWDALQHQAETAEAERDAAVQDTEKAWDQAVDWQLERDDARAALQKIADDPLDRTDTESVDLFQHLARAALAGNQGCEYHRPLRVNGCTACDALDGGALVD